MQEMSNPTDKIDPETRAEFERDPGASVKLIVRSIDDPSRHADRLHALGFTVKHLFSLTRAAAIEGRAAEGLALADEPWVLKIERDRPVRAL